jgi:hypothetical protein
LDALRAVPGPVTVREITDAILAAKGVTNATEKQRAGLEAGLRASLENHAGKTVERVGNGIPRRWRLLKSDEFSFVFLRRLRFGDGRRPIAL